MIATQVIVTVLIVHLVSRGVLNYANLILDRIEWVKTRLRERVLAFWITTIISTILMGWSGLLVALSIAYVANEIGNFKCNKR